MKNRKEKRIDRVTVHEARVNSNPDSNNILSLLYFFRAFLE